MTFVLISNRKRFQAAALRITSNWLVVSKSFLEEHNLLDNRYCDIYLDFSGKKLALNFRKERSIDSYKLNLLQNGKSGYYLNISRILTYISNEKIKVQDIKEENYEFKKSHDQMKNIWIIDLNPYIKNVDTGV